MSDTILEWLVPDNTGAKPLVLLHGFLGGASDWEEFVSRFSDYACYGPDLPGHGDSTSEKVMALKNIDAVADAISMDMDTLGITSAAVLGYSMGGRVALHLAIRAPEKIKALILESASPGIDSLAERTLRFMEDSKLAKRLRSIDSDLYSYNEFLREWYSSPLFHTLADHPDFEKIVLSRLETDTVMLARSLEIMGVGKQKSLWAELSNLDIPVLAIAGLEDEKFTGITEKMSEINPRIVQQFFAECSHCVHWEDPKGYTNAVRTFLART